MSVARLNFSHGTLAEHTSKIRLIRSVAHELGTSIGVLVDLPGPKVRVGTVSPEPVDLKVGSQLTLTGRHVTGNQRIVSISHPSILSELSKGDPVSLEDGTIKLMVQQRKNGDVICRVIRGGALFSGKGVNIPWRKLGLKALTPNDIRLLRFALQNGVDFVGLSFVTTSDDVVRAKKIVSNARSRAWVIAKIERRQAVEDFDEIVRVADGIMIARGDLGVEMAIEDVPVLQKRIIEKANAAGKPTVTATQMLESMMTNPTPTRAEVTDIANAIFDGSDADHAFRRNGGWEVSG